MTALNTMLPVRLEVRAEQFAADGQPQVSIHLRNSSEHIAFFERATITASEGGNEILPIRYDDNYITVYPGESAEIHGTVAKAAGPRWVRLEGYNTPPVCVPIK
jgi:exo-1,4-beta-D-glucosaminidase